MKLFSKLSVQLLLVAVAYFVTGRLGLLFAAISPSTTLFWLPTGIAVAALWRWGFPIWPGVTLGGFAINWSVGTPGPVALARAAGLKV